MDNKEMDQNRIDELNNTIPFVDTKIFWKEDYGWTSRYWESLRETGWTMVQSKNDPETVIALDENGNECLSAPGRLTLLKLLVNYILVG